MSCPSFLELLLSKTRVEKFLGKLSSEGQLIRIVSMDGDSDTNPENAIYKIVRSQIVFLFQCANRSSFRFI